MSVIISCFVFWEIFSLIMEGFERDILQELNRWAEKKLRKTLVLRGARQVGNTSVFFA